MSFYLWEEPRRSATGVTITHVLSVGSKSKWICRRQDKEEILRLKKICEARIIPRIIPDTYPESYLNLALLCHGPAGPFKNKLWELLRRRSKGIQARANHTPNHTPETYLRNIPRIIPPDATRFAEHGIFGKGHIWQFVSNAEYLEKSVWCDVCVFVTLSPHNLQLFKTPPFSVLVPGTSGFRSLALDEVRRMQQGNCDDHGMRCGCFLKWWYPQITHFNRVFHYKPSILGYPNLWKHPCLVMKIGQYIQYTTQKVFNRFWSDQSPQIKRHLGLSTTGQLFPT